MIRPSFNARSSRAAVVTALAATMALAACTPASATNVRVTHALFGMHDGTATSSSLGQVHEGAVRLWDVGVEWREVQVRASGVKYNWSRLDQLVSAAQAAHAEVTMVVAGTPSFYSANPWNVPAKRIPAYKAFIKAMMLRYKSFGPHGRRGIAAYEVWNEGNIATFWTGGYPALARLAQAMDAVRDQVDPHAKVIAPPMVTRLRYQMTGLSKFYAQRVARVPVWRYVDAVALSLYPLPKYGARTGVPEDAMKQLTAARKRLHRDGVPATKPIWNTEVNYGLQSGSQGGTRAAAISDARQVANVIRTYLLNAANGIKRVFWYRYDFGRFSSGGTLANTLLTSPTDSAVVTPAGNAFLRVQRWMHGTLLGTRTSKPCRADRVGTYTCVVKDATGVRRIYWNPFHSGRVKLAANAHHLTTEFGARSSVRPGSTIKVGFKPVMAGR